MAHTKRDAHKKLSLLSLLSLKTTLCLRILSCVCFKDNRDNRDNLQFCPSWRDFYIIDNSVLACFFTPLVVQVYKLRSLSVFPHISYAQLGGVAFTASIFVCITRSNLNLTTGTNALNVYIAHSYHWFVVFFHNKAPCAEGAILNFEFWILNFELSAFSRCWVFEFWFSLLKAPAFFTFLFFLPFYL